MSTAGTVVDLVVGHRLPRTALRGVAQLAQQLRLPSRARLAVRVSMLLSGRSRHDDAAAVLRTAERRARRTDERTDLGLRRALAELAGGREPSDLDARLAGALRRADEMLAEEELRGCADMLAQVLLAAFHPARHIGDGPPQQLADPAAFTGLLQASAAFRALTSTDPDGSRRERRPAARLLVVSNGNHAFLGQIIEDYRAVGGLEVRVLHLDDHPAVLVQEEIRSLTLARLRRGVTGERLPVPPDLRETVSWADTIFVEWGHRAMAWVSLLDGVQARVVARVHRYEVMTPLPVLTDWGAVDDLVVVAEPVLAILRSTVPGLAPGSGTRVAVVPNRTDLERFRLPKADEAARTCALVGWSKRVKDPMWALDVLDVLREDDRRWRLLLVGPDDPDEDRAREYHRALRRRIAALGDAVEITGHTPDVAGVLTRVGVILSTSLVEGTHEALLEGAASGALPVVRDWPHLTGWGGPAAQYPADWVVADPAGAAARILRSAAPDRTGSAAAEAQQWVFAHRRWQSVRPRFDAVVLGRGAA